jgi:sodium transport system permease protein
VTERPSSRGPRAPWGLVGLVLRGELVRLARDRRAVIFGLVVPAVLFPVLFLFSGSLERIGREQLEAREVRVAVDLAALDPADAAALTAGLAADDARIAAVEASLDAPPAPGGVRALLERLDADLLVDSRPPAAPGEPARLVLYAGAADENAEEAIDRVRRIARRVLRDARDRRLAEAVGGDPGARYELVAVDVARAEDAAGRRLGGLLPLLAVLVLISGGSFAALDAFVGEREAGTLETLLVQPVPARTVAWGKFLAVLCTGLVAFLGNALSLLLCLRLGLGDPGAIGAAAGGAEVDWGTAATRIAFGCALFLPTTALVAAVLSHVAARARTFGQGQLLTMPLTFLAMALAAPAMQPTTELGPLLALVPLTGAALALRDAAAGAFTPLPMGIAVAASCAWASFALSRLARTLDAERLLATPDTSAEASARKLAAGRAVRFGLAASLVIYLAGGRLQAEWPLGGLLATLWGLVLALALVAAKLSARGLAATPPRSLVDALGLRPPRVAHAAGALCLAPAIALGVQRLFELQQRLLPMPSRVGEAAELVGFTADLSLPMLVLVMAVSPGICEELLFRGALLEAMRRDLRPRAVILWQALLFGVVHASIYRFLPTAAVGAILAAVALHARSVIPAMLLHTGYNGLLVAAGLGGVAWAGSPVLALLALPGLALFALPSSRPNPQDERR